MSALYYQKKTDTREEDEDQLALYSETQWVEEKAW